MIKIEKIYIEEIGTVTLRKASTTKNFRLTVKNNGEILVGTPLRVSKQEVMELILSKKEWILKSIKKQENKQENKQPKQIPNSLSILGKAYHIRLFEKDKPLLAEEGNDTILYLPKTATEERIEDMKEHFYSSVIRMEAKNILPSRLFEWSKKLDLPYNACRIKNNKTNWGSCSGKGNINLNMHLIRLPKHLMDMVLVHELMHTIIPNHGDDFQKAMGKIFPNIKQLNKEMKEYHPHTWGQPI